jgi:tRNA(fMet)-specific endonuclease VapC
LTYLLDTNACIALINGRPAAVRSCFQSAIDSGAQVNVSTIVVFELWYGVGKSQRQESNTERLKTFLAGPIGLTVFDDEDAKVAGTIRAKVEAKGQPIGAYDLMIAGQAVRHKATLVTANTREFARVRGLDWEDWANS